ncbi:MAG: LysR substrate-binding domain-containing protein [Candidatus Thiodiazotropha sp. L084R]
MLELISLRTFKVVVDEGGILSASRKLNTVQSNVTTRVKRLEEELNSELFYRKGRGLTLAPAGRVLYDYACQILQLETQAGVAVRQVGEQSGELRIGAMETFASFRLAPALKHLKQAHKGVDLRVETDTSSSLIERVLQHKLDCAFVAGSVDQEELLVCDIGREELVLVHAKHNEPKSQLILFREGCAYRARALAWRRERGQQVSEVMELGTLDGILGCVSVGLGCTLLPSWVVAQSHYADDLIVEQIPPYLAMVQTVMIRHKQGVPMVAMETLAQAVVESTENTIAAARLKTA